MLAVYIWGLLTINAAAVFLVKNPAAALGSEADLRSENARKVSNLAAFLALQLLIVPQKTASQAF